MFNSHLIIDNNGEKYLYLFINFNYEFSREFKSDKNTKMKTLKEKVMDYIKEKKINILPAKVFLVVGGLVIGSIFVQNYKYNDLKNTMEPNYEYVEEVDIFNNKDILETPAVKNNNTSEIQTTKEKAETITDTNITQPNTNTTTQSTTPTSNNQVVSKPNTTTQTTQSTSTPVPVQPPTVVQPQPEVVTAPQPTEPAPAPAPPPAPTEKMVTLYRSIGTIETMSLEDYVVGVVGAEMPASFNSEALKAQSVIARTYALKKIDQNEILKDDVSHQVYKDNSQLKALWGSSFDTYYNKIKNAVAATKGQTITYDGKYIEAVYHSTSNGMTEDAVVVWGNNYPYLKPVDSHWDINASSYLRETEKEFSVLSSIIGLDFNAETKIEVLSRTESNRIDKIQIDDKIFTGIELRNLLGLRSTDFDIKIENGKTIITTRGYGHGVGMSQYGANGMANEGNSYKEILSHYYPGTNIKS